MKGRDRSSRLIRGDADKIPLQQFLLHYPNPKPILHLELWCKQILTDLIYTIIG